MYKDLAFNSDKYVLVDNGGYRVLNNGQGMNNKTSAVYVDVGSCLVLFQNEQFNTNKTFLFFQSGYHILDDYDFDNKTSSVLIFDSTYSGCAEDSLVYFHRHVKNGEPGGIKFAASPGASNNLNSYWNNEISAITIPFGRNYCVTVTNGIDGGGTKVLDIDVEQIILKDVGWNDQISWWSVRRSNC
ncbi:hypothetical protein [Paraglaciecola sp.]|uniref:hypothetical protein n=1 Tax=Paraglaciecola sp. TaxID=1920173 RepID=UPI0032668C47